MHMYFCALCILAHVRSVRYNSIEVIAFMGKTSAAAKNKYAAKAYDRIALQVYKGAKDKLRAHADARGESLNGFINRAIREALERDGAYIQEMEPRTDAQDD